MLGKTTWTEAEAVGIDAQGEIRARLRCRICKTEVAD